MKLSNVKRLKGEFLNHSNLPNITGTVDKRHQTCCVQMCFCDTFHQSYGVFAAPTGAWYYCNPATGACNITWELTSTSLHLFKLLFIHLCPPFWIALSLSLSSGSLWKLWNEGWRVTGSVDHQGNFFLRQQHKSRVPAGKQFWCTCCHFACLW